VGFPLPFSPSPLLSLSRARPAPATGNGATQARTGRNTGPWWFKVASQLMRCIIHHILPSPVPYVLLGRTRAHGFRLAMLHLPQVSKARAHVQQPCSCCTRGTADRLFSAYIRLCCRACTHSGILGSCCVSVAMCRELQCAQIVVKWSSSLLLHALATYPGGRDWVASGSDVSRLYSSVRSACKSCDMLID
jgi:hypothetical protein